jgi:hypothetical protein
MSRVSPTLEGFRAAFRRPLLTFAEIAWRWSVGGVAAGLLAFAFFEYLDSLPVNDTEAFFLRSRQPFLAGQAVAHILRGSLQRAALAALAGAIGLAVLWIVAASLGRVATVRGLLDYFAITFQRQDGGCDSCKIADASRQPLRALFRLNFLRAVLVLASVIGFQGAAILAGFASPEADPQPGLAFLLFLALAGLICLAWWALNWLLSLAAVFAVRDGEDALGALSAAVTLCRERAGAVFAVSTWTGLAYLFVFFGATTIVSMPLGLARVAPARLVIAGVIFVALAYFAVAGWLYMVRLAGYVCIVEMPEALLAPAPLPPAPSRAGEVAPIETTIDRDEPILSDVPNLAVET